MSYGCAQVIFVSPTNTSTYRNKTAFFHSNGDFEIPFGNKGQRKAYRSPTHIRIRLDVKDGARSSQRLALHAS